MNIYIKSYPAKNGDSFLVSYGLEESKHILIDCGYIDTFENYIKNDLLAISERGECLEKLIITHIDSDHIWGSIKLFKENNKKHFIKIKEVWHNSFRHLSDKDLQGKDTKKEQLLKRIVQRGYSQNIEKQGINDISAEQGTTVGALLLEGNYSWNSDFKNQAVCIENREFIELDNDSRIHLLSPDQTKLQKLKNLWKDELQKFGTTLNFDKKESDLFDDAFEMLMSWERENIKTGGMPISKSNKSIEELITIPFDEDRTATNGSSIAFVLEVGVRKILFLGDSHPSLIFNSLCKIIPDKLVFFDLIKVSHHGSFNNINKDLLSKIDSTRYLFSTNGKGHNHPDQATIAHIVSRKTEFKRELFFNYRTVNSEYFNRKDWMEKFNYIVTYLDKEPYSIKL